MKTNVDMTYRFTQNDEPTDEQLHVIMQEVADDARRGHEEVAKQVLENIQDEFRRISSVYSVQMQ
jgi:hypothetical protein